MQKPVNHPDVQGELVVVGLDEIALGQQVEMSIYFFGVDAENIFGDALLTAHWWWFSNDWLMPEACQPGRNLVRMNLLGAADKAISIFLIKADGRKSLAPRPAKARLRGDGHVARERNKSHPGLVRPPRGLDRR